MKKRIISILMTAMVSLSLLACGTNNAGESETIPNITEAAATSTAAETEEKVSIYSLQFFFSNIITL